MVTAFSEATLRGIEPRYKEKFDAALQNFTRKPAAMYPQV